MISVVIGIWAVTVTVAAGQIAQSAVSEEVELAAGRPATLRLSLVGDLDENHRSLDPELRQRIAGRLQRYGIGDFSAVREYAGFAGYGQFATGIRVSGVEPNFARVRRVDVLAGRWLSNADMGLYGPALILNTQAVSQLHIGSPVDAVGKRVEISGSSPVTGIVVGVIKSAPGEGSSAVFLPITAVDHWKAPASTVETNYFLIHAAPEVASQITNVLKFEAPKWKPGLSAEITRIDNADSFKTGIATLQLVLSLVAAISLAAGGVGILNLGLVTIRERVRELGIRRAFGATRADLFAMVLSETLLISAVAGVVGVGVAVATTMLLPQITGLFIPNPASAQFPPAAVAIGMTLAITLGGFVGLLPAYRATRLDVIAAIRG